MKRRLRVLVAVTTLFALIAAACGSGGGRSHVVKIGVIAPLTGGLAPFGAGIRKTAALAIEEAKKNNLLSGWTIEYDPQDDASDAKQGASAAQKLAAEPETAAIVGTLNSSVALAVQPILKQTSIPMVSPANTDVSLTQGLKWQTAPKRQYANYFRVVATDKQQGAAAAKYAYDKLGRRTAVAIHDKKTYGQGLANIFSDNFRKLGGTVKETIPVNPGEGDYKSAVTKAQGDKPDIIFYGGEFPEAGVIAKNMGELGMRAPNVILMGGDGIDNKTFVKLGGPAAQGHYATTVGANATFLDTAKSFVSKYKAKYGNEDYGIYGPPTWDATNIILNALAKVLKGQDKITADVRKKLVPAIQSATIDGALGKTTFDRFGDTTNKILTINEVQGADFKPLGKLTVD